MHDKLKKKKKKKKKKEFVKVFVYSFAFVTFMAFICLTTVLSYNMNVTTIIIVLLYSATNFLKQKQTAMILSNQIFYQEFDLFWNEIIHSVFEW